MSSQASSLAGGMGERLRQFDLRRKFIGLWGKPLVVAVPWIWLILFFIIPFLVVLRISLSPPGEGAMPFGSMFNFERGQLDVTIDFGNFMFLFTDSLYLDTYARSVLYAVIATFFCLLIGYPLAYAIARSSPDRRPILLMLLMVPFWTSLLLRIYAIKMLMSNSGVINNTLIGLGIIDSPISMLYTEFSLLVGMVYCYLPFMILPLYASLVKLDERYLEAASDLGCSPFKSFWKITVPLTRNGIIAGCMLVFIPLVGEFVIPELLGGPGTLMIGRLLWDEMFANNDWPMAAAVAVVMILIIIVPLAVFFRSQAKAGAAA